ncbi:MAG: LysR family transcriptional regulator [Proteobacteria bacterium]|nr:LysR family transcriptional regulator [Pseudomonadota bacterium]
MNLIQIEYFVRVAELGSFTRAALVLGVPQPSLSRQVRALETELRHSLLHRNGRGVEVTPAGQCFLEHGHALLETARRAVGAMDELRTAPRGRVVIGLPSRVAKALTTPLVKAFRERFPEAAITIAEGVSTVLHEWLVLGRVEIALLFDPVYSAELELKLLYSEDLVLVGPKAARSLQPRVLPLSQLKNYPLILPRMPNAARSVLASAAAHAGVDLTVSVEVDTMSNILELVAGRMGFGVMPAGAVRAAGGEARYRTSRIQSPVIRNRLYLATYKHRRHTKLASEMKSVLATFDLAGLLE